MLTFELPTPFLVGPVNVYLIKSDTLTLIDAGPRTEQGLLLLKQQLKTVGYTIDDIEQIIITHHHPDHVGLLDAFSDSTKISGHIKNKKWLEKDAVFFERMKAFFNKLYLEHGVSKELISSIMDTNDKFMELSPVVGMDSFLKEGDDISGLPGWRVIETPGHAQSHISLFHDESGIMVAGDHILANISSNAILEAPYEENTERPKTLIQYRQSLLKCREMDIHKIYSGHGPTISNSTQLIDERLKAHDIRASEIKMLLSEHAHTCFDIVKKMFPSIYLKQPTLTFSEVLGHLDLLISREEIKAEKADDGKTYFYHC